MSAFCKKANRDLKKIHHSVKKNDVFRISLPIYVQGLFMENDETLMKDTTGVLL